MLGARQIFGLVATLAVLSPAAFQAQVKIEPRAKRAPKPTSLPGSTLRVDTNLVLVPVSVNDPLSRPVSGLEKENFRLFEDKVEQAITNFAMDDEPIAAGLVFDTSGSMANKLNRSRVAAAEFFKIANPDDEFFLIEFDSKPRLVVPLTSNTAEIQNKLAFSRSGGSTALLDAVYMAMHEMKKSKKNKKALLIISDGGDNHSRYTVAEVRNIVVEADVLIYAIGVFDGGMSAEEAGGPGLLSHLAEQTGGRLLYANARELPDMAQKIGIELRNRYVLGYMPKNQERDGKYRRIEVKVIPPRGLPKLRAHWRLGYNAPPE